ncbi:hypothetical protein ACSSS7_006484 [Eimeria intestinalis]
MLAGARPQLSYAAAAAAAAKKGGPTPTVLEGKEGGAPQGYKAEDSPDFAQGAPKGPPKSGGAPGPYTTSPPVVGPLEARKPLTCLLMEIAGFFIAIWGPPSPEAGEAVVGPQQGGRGEESVPVPSLRE